MGNEGNRKFFVLLVEKVPKVPVASRVTGLVGR